MEQTNEIWVKIMIPKLHMWCYMVSSIGIQEKISKINNAFSRIIVSTHDIFENFFENGS